MSLIRGREGASRVSQLLELLPSKHWGPDSNPSTAEKLGETEKEKEKKITYSSANKDFEGTV
jgi:hypothetical protein